MKYEKPTVRRRGAVAILMREGRLLVIRRAQCVRAPGKYCFPGGGIEAGETEQEALCREIREELNVAVQPTRLAWRSVTPWGVELAWWIAQLRPEDEPTANPAEVEWICWCTPDEMALLPGLLESNREFLEALASGEIVLDG